MFSKLFDRIEDKRSDLIELTQELVRIPTINPPGDAYTSCAQFIGERLRKKGFQIEYIRGNDTPGDSDKYPRTNIIARIEGKSTGPTIHFNSHIDVVETGEGWTLDPFEAKISDGKIFGRGTCDMKGGLAASIIAVEAYIEVDSEFSGAIEISGTVDEESGGFGGVAYLAQQGYFSKPRVDHVIIPEPLNKERVCLGHRGVWWAELETKGKIAHGSMPFLGDCAIRHMGAVLHAFEEQLFPKLSQKTTSMPVAPKGAGQATLNINSIHGGQIEPSHLLPTACVPDSCRVVIDRRFLMEENLDDVKQEVFDLLESIKSNRADFQYQIRDIMEVLPALTDKNSPVVKAVANSIKSVLGRPAEFVISPGTYDQKHINRIGHLQDCIAYGPGMLDLAHIPDEYVIIDDMIESAKVMAMSTHALLNQV